jgi:hypothetical protein
VSKFEDLTGGTAMTRIIMLMLAVAVILIVAPTSVVGQSGKDLVGTWTLISAITERDGKKFDTFGPDTKGVLVFDPNGHYAIVFIGAGLPKFASNNRAAGTADENKAVVAGSLAHFGTYIVNEADKSFSFRIERATFPNWDNLELRRAFVISGDQLVFTDPHASAGGAAAVTWKRAR